MWRLVRKHSRICVWETVEGDNLQIRQGSDCKLYLPRIELSCDITVRTRNITVRNGSDAVVYEIPCQGRQLRNLAASPYAVAVDCEQSALSAYSIESMVESPLDGGLQVDCRGVSGFLRWAKTPFPGTVWYVTRVCDVAKQV